MYAITKSFNFVLQIFILSNNDLYVSWTRIINKLRINNKKELQARFLFQIFRTYVSILLLGHPQCKEIKQIWQN